MATASKVTSRHVVVLEDQIKHVLYDMLILAMSVRYMQSKWPREFANRKFGPEEVAKQMALVKFRSLEKFLFRPDKGDDISLKRFVDSKYCDLPKRGTPEFHKFGDAVANTYAVHLTRQRTLRKVPFPRTKDVIKHSRTLLEKCNRFAQQCINAGIDLKYDKGWAEHYWQAFHEECTKLKL